MIRICIEAIRSRRMWGVSLLAVILTWGRAGAQTPEQFRQLTNLAKGGRYMESGETLPVRTRLEGWEKVQDRLKMFRYRPSRTDGGKIPEKLDVILFDPSPETVADWVVDAVKHCLGDYDHEVAVQFTVATRVQSGFQFPVRGFVYENGAVYSFFDGVTVALRLGEEAQPSQLGDSSLAVLRTPAFESTALYRSAFAARYEDGVFQARQKGRIFSVRRGAEGIPAGSAEFCAFVRDKHIEAMAGGKSELARLKLRELLKPGRDKGLELMAKSSMSFLGIKERSAYQAQIDRWSR